MEHKASGALDGRSQAAGRLKRRGGEYERAHVGEQASCACAAFGRSGEHRRKAVGPRDTGYERCERSGDEDS